MNRRSDWPAFFLYLALAYGITWLAWLPGLLQGRSIFTISVPLTLLGGMGPAAAAIIVTAVSGGRTGLLDLGRRLVKWRVPAGWYLVALLLPLVCAVAAMAIAAAGLGSFPGFALPAERDGTGQLLALLLSTFLIQTLLTGGNEELGWRGYALPALQARFSALTASLLLALIWALWHLPLFFMAGTSQSQVPFLRFLLFTLPLTMVFTWVHNQTGGSILLVMLLHGTVNTTAELLRISLFEPPMLIAWWLAAALTFLLGSLRHPERRAR